MKHNPTIEYIYKSDIKPTISIVLPVHNQESIINLVVESIFKNTYNNFELFLIFDGCTDLSKNNALKNLEIPINACSITYIINPIGIFETSCDNQGFSLSQCEYIIEIQADMIILTKHYDIILCKPLIKFNDLIAISGRCCHKLTDDSKGVGKLGILVNNPHQQEIDGNTIYLSHTCNRGPICFRHSMLQALNYLDEDHYVLGDDEHDLFARAWVQYKWRTAFFPIEYQSKLEWGSTRKTRPQHIQQYLDNRLSNMKEGYLVKYKNNISFPNDETRFLC